MTSRREIMETLEGQQIWSSDYEGRVTVTGGQIVTDRRHFTPTKEQARELLREVIYEEWSTNDIATILMRRSSFTLLCGRKQARRLSRPATLTAGEAIDKCRTTLDGLLRDSVNWEEIATDIMYDSSLRDSDDLWVERMDRSQSLGQT